MCKRIYVYVCLYMCITPPGFTIKLNSISAAVRYFAEYTIIIFRSGTNPLVVAVET
jgi:hypothetical protein